MVQRCSPIQVVSQRAEPGIIRRPALTSALGVRIDRVTVGAKVGGEPCVIGMGQVGIFRGREMCLVTIAADEKRDRGADSLTEGFERQVWEYQAFDHRASRLSREEVLGWQCQEFPRLLWRQPKLSFLHDALDALQETLPHVEHVEYAGLGHDGPDETAPERIGKELRAFFSKSS